MATTQHKNQDLDFDPDALRDKYRKERDKRLRADGINQFQEVTGEFAHFVDDPYVVPGFTRDPLNDEVDVVIVGGGFGGLMAGARLREAGLENIRIVDKAGDFGGAWYWNRYPGAQCDIESYMYLPLLEEVGYIPKEKYSYAEEIFAHARRIGKFYDLYRNACFQTEIRELKWDKKLSRWIVYTDRGDRMRAQFVIMCSGLLNRPKLPSIPGIQDFAGHTFHTSRWDYGYTGGDQSGSLDKLHDKRVGIIGTGCTAIQCIPHLAEAAEHLYVFQRTPSSVDVRGNKPTDPEWVKTLKPGWQKHRRENFNTLVFGGKVEVDLVNDAWTDIFRSLDNPVALTDAEETEGNSQEDATKILEIADFKKMNQIRARVEEMVKDKQAAEALKPWYRQFCKRPAFNDDYLPTFNRPNVTLVDTEGKGVERITRTGVVVNGKEYKVDCLIFSTGFEVGTAYTRRANMEVRGRNGLTLTEHWSDGMKTLHGNSSHGFPNLFHMGILQNGLSPNNTSMFDDQATQIAYLIQQVRSRNMQSIEPTSEGESAWVATILELQKNAYDFYEACTPGFFNSEGNPGSRDSLIGNTYAPGIGAFNKLLEEWRESGKLEGFFLE